MRGDKIERMFTYVVLWLFVVVLIGPFLWLVSSSFKGLEDIFSNTLDFIPRDSDGNIYFTLDNYINAFNYLDFDVMFLNTFIVTVTATAANIFFNSMAGYSFARLKFKGRDLIFKIMLGSLMIPGTVLLVPNMIIINEMGLYDTLAALILPFMMSVYNIFLMRQYFLTFPKELEESAIIDGANWFQILIRIAMPLAKPMIVTLGIFTFMWNYNNFLWPLVVITSDSNQTLALGLGSLVAGATQTIERYPIMIASTVIATVPLVVIFMFLQKHIVKGINAGGVKG